MFKRIVNGGIGKMQKELLKKLESHPEGERKEKLRKIVEDFLPAFKKALRDGDANKLLELKKACDELDVH